MKLFIIVIILVVAASIVAGLVLSGPPSMERRRQLDEVRSNHLESIASAVDDFYREKGRLPGTLFELTAPNTPRPPESIFDPATRAVYEYEPTGPETYNLCATFEADRRADAGAPGKRAPGREPPHTRFQNHGVGRTCFSLIARKSAANPP